VQHVDAVRCDGGREHDAEALDGGVGRRRRDGRRGDGGHDAAARLKSELPRRRVARDLALAEPANGAGDDGVVRAD
jgi:hypothetical protein